MTEGNENSKKHPVKVPTTRLVRKKPALPPRVKKPLRRKTRKKTPKAGQPEYVPPQKMDILNPNLDRGGMIGTLARVPYSEAIYTAFQRHADREIDSDELDNLFYEETKAYIQSLGAKECALGFGSELSIFVYLDESVDDTDKDPFNYQVIRTEFKLHYANNISIASSEVEQGEIYDLTHVFNPNHAKEPIKVLPYTADGYVFEKSQASRLHSTVLTQRGELKLKEQPNDAPFAIFTYLGTIYVLSGYEIEQEGLDQIISDLKQQNLIEYEDKS